MTKHLGRLLILAVCFTLFSPQANAQFYYGLQQQFGKNRVQYHDFVWSYYRTSSYDVYYYRKSREIAQYVAEEAGKQLTYLQKFLDFPLDDRLEFIVYNKHSDLKQSNIELTTNEEYNTGGLSKIVGSRVFLYFEGDYRKLQNQIKAGIVQVILNQMMYGGNIRDVIRSSTFINLPEWYTSGLVSYLSQPDNIDIQNRIRDGVRSQRFEKFKILQPDELVAAGHAIWQYIAFTYGRSVIPQILYMTRINNNIESGFNFILGTDLISLNQAWLNFYKDQLLQTSSANPSGKALKLKTNEQSKVSQFKLNPDRDVMAYVTNEIGQYKVYVQGVNDEERKRVYKGGYAIDPKTDYSYPLLAWHPNGRILAMVLEEEGNIQLKIRDIDEEKWMIERPVYYTDKFLSMEYAPDGRTLLISAMRAGQSDIFEYSVLSNTFNQITDDIYEDLQPVYLDGDKYIAFASTRPVDSLIRDADTLDPMPTTDLFIYKRDQKKLLWRLTNTNDLNETHLDRLGKSSLVYLVDREGYVNRNILQLDSAISYVDTITHYRYFTRKFRQSDYKHNILEHDVDPKLGNVAELFFYNGAYQLHLNKIMGIEGLLEEEEKKMEPRLPEAQDSLVPESVPVDTVMVDTSTQDSLSADSLVNSLQDSIPSEPEPEIAPLRKIKKEFDLENYQFHPDLVNSSVPETRPKLKEEKPEQNTTAKKPVEEEVGEIPFEFPKPKNYVRAFYTNYFVSQLDNSFLDQSYQPYAGGGPIYLNPSFNGLIKLGLGDLFEDYKLIGAVRLATSLENAEYYLSLKNLEKRWDHIYNFNRKTLSSVVDEVMVEQVTVTSAEYQTAYPLSEVAAIKGSIGLRYDHGVILATDNISLAEGDRTETWAQIRLQYVFDNTIPKGINLYNGLRYKAFYEYYQNTSSFDEGMHVIGADIRHYQKLHRSLIWANRFAISSSFGQNQLIYFMGGVDSWFNPKYNFETPISQKKNYAFQTLATNMRGFHQNARNGNSFFAYNTELRLPLFTYILDRPLKSDFVRNFQVLTFFDVGSAWTGTTPYSPENALNNTIIKNGGVTIQLDKQREPIIYGYGFGVRSKVLGYFVRADWAWGVEDGLVLPRVFYLSLSQDF